MSYEVKRFGFIFFNHKLWNCYSCDYDETFVWSGGTSVVKFYAIMEEYEYDFAYECRVGILYDK